MQRCRCGAVAECRRRGSEPGLGHLDGPGGETHGLQRRGRTVDPSLRSEHAGGHSSTSGLVVASGDAYSGPVGGRRMALDAHSALLTGFQKENTLSCLYTVHHHGSSYLGPCVALCVLCNMLRQQSSVSAQYLHQRAPSIASAPFCAVRQMAAAHQRRRGHNVCSSLSYPSPRPYSLAAFACNRRRHLPISSESES